MKAFHVTLGSHAHFTHLLAQMFISVQSKFVLRQRRQNVIGTIFEPEIGVSIIHKNRGVAVVLATEITSSHAVVRFNLTLAAVYATEELRLDAFKGCLLSDDFLISTALRSLLCINDSLLVHFLVEVLVCCGFKQMEVIFDLSEGPRLLKLLGKSIDLESFIWVLHCQVLTFLVDIKRSVTLHLLGLLIVASLLISEANELAAHSWLASFVRFKRAHNLFGRCCRLMSGLPYLLRFVHEWVLIADLHAMNYVLLRQNLSVLVCQLENLIGHALLGSLIFLKIFNARLISKEFREHIWLTPDVVHIRRVLRLAVVK